MMPKMHKNLGSWNHKNITEALIMRQLHNLGRTVERSIV
jgi:hypothetical protein